MASRRRRRQWEPLPRTEMVVKWLVKNATTWQQAREHSGRVDRVDVPFGPIGSVKIGVSNLDACAIARPASQSRIGPRCALDVLDSLSPNTDASYATNCTTIGHYYATDGPGSRHRARQCYTLLPDSNYLACGRSDGKIYALRGVLPLH